MDETLELGPAMRALPNDRMRRFVRACVTPTATGEVNYTAAAREAGYQGDAETMRATGYRLAHDERVQAAMLEEGQRLLGASLPLATATVIQIMTTSLKNSDRLKAATILMDRGGMPARSEHHVKVEKPETEGEMIERVIRMAKALNLDARTLLGNIGIQVPAQLAAPTEGNHSQVVDAEFEPALPAGLEDFLK